MYQPKFPYGFISITLTGYLQKIATYVHWQIVGWINRLGLYWTVT